MRRLKKSSSIPRFAKPMGKDFMNEADEERHVAKVLIAELESRGGREVFLERWSASCATLI